MKKSHFSQESLDEENNIAEEEAPAKALDRPLSYEELEGNLNEAEAQLNEAITRAEEYKNQVLRAQADAENVKKRAEKDAASQIKSSLTRFINELLPIIDGIERGLSIEVGDNEFAKHMHEGLEMTLKLFNEALVKFDVKPIDPINQAFNPELHQAVSTLPNPEVPENTIIQVLQKGYQLGERLIRPALVIVAKKS